MRGILKRKFDQLDDHPCYSSSSSSSSSSSPSSSLSSPASSEWESDGESGPSNLNQDFTPHGPPPPTSVPIRSIFKRPRLTLHQTNVHFDLVTVFSFPRCQGFSSVPSHGGSSLGMARRHCALQRYTVAEHAAERRRRRAQKLQERAREERLEAFKQKLISSGAIDQARRLTVDHLPEEEEDAGVSDGELREGGSLQPYSSRQRQAILLAAGVKRIDKEEKRQLHALRLSREDCGCDCQGFCEPETCACSLAGIKCQVDRFSFPCGCTRDGCGNTEGYTEFDARRVRTHYIHTIMRLELERTIQDKSRGVETRPPERLVQSEEPIETKPVDSEPDKNCPFGFSQEDSGLPLTMPTVAAFSLRPEQSAMEENSCSSNTTESSCSDSEAASLTNTFFTSLMHRPDTPVQHTSDGQFPDLVENRRTSGYVDENANPARGLFEDESLECLSSAPSPTLDYCRYIDPSLSSDSDLEFFDSDYPCGPLHSSFKAPRLQDSVHQLQLFSSVVLPHYDSSTFLLESLISD